MIPSSEFILYVQVCERQGALKRIGCGLHIIVNGSLLSRSVYLMLRLLSFVSLGGGEKCQMIAV
jgi:hypothetical protein